MALLANPHWETISSELRNLLIWIGEQDFSSRFYLAGGSGLSLQLGHRRSIDLDFFSEVDEVTFLSRNQIIQRFSPRGGQVVENVDGNLLLGVESIHVGFFSYGYPLLEERLFVENVALASILDIGLMKLDAVIGRGSRKDFYDLYFINRLYPLAELLEAGQVKYPQARDFPMMALEGLITFDNARRDVQPDLLTEIPWEEIENFFTEQVRGLGKNWFEI